MTSKLYVGNLAFHTTESTLSEAFAKYGEVSEVKLILDRETGRSRGFAFVTMATSEAAQDVIANMNQQELDGRSLRVREAEDRPSGGGGGGGGPRGGGGGGFGGGGGGRSSGGPRGGGGGDRGGRGGGGDRGGRGGGGGGGGGGNRW